MSQFLSPQQRFHAWLADNPDQALLRWIFRGVVTLTLAALAYDLAGINGWTGQSGSGAMPAEIRQDAPVPDLPGVSPSLLAPFWRDGNPRLRPLPEPEGALAKPMSFDLIGGGRLVVTGTIMPGIFQTFAEEIKRHGEYIKIVVLNSPGGSVADALAMGRLIRERKFATEVEAGKYCASSCPLVFAGGLERRVGERATIGVHQVAAVKAAAGGPPRDEMSVAQNISARCQRYLGDMGVSLQVWVRAMETPHDKLFVFGADELKSLNLVTASPIAAPPATSITSAPVKPRS